MPHTRQPPKTVEEILATAELDPEWTSIQEEQPLPKGKDWGDDVTAIKTLSQGTLPQLRATLDASRPEDVKELDINMEIPSTQLKPEGGKIRVLVCQPASLEGNDKQSPVIILYHGGGHTVGNPESELLLARLLVQQYHAVVVMPAYRLAPEHKFPSSFSDSLEVLKIVAEDITILKQHSQPTDAGNPTTQRSTRIINRSTHPSNALVIGGTSAGGTITCSINHLYHTFRNSTSPHLPPLTGLFISCGSCINPSLLSPRYKPYFLSRDQNIDEPPLDRDMYLLFKNAAEMDHTSPIWGSFDQHPELATSRDSVAEDHVWMAGLGDLPQQPPIRVYFQICGNDMSRDDGLVYERVLREECGVQTRLDLYTGFGHVFWGMRGKYPEMEMSKKRLRDSVEAVGWLIGG